MLGSRKTADEFSAKRYIWVEQLVSKRDLERLFRHAMRRLRNETIHPDIQVPDALAGYGDPHMEGFLQHLLPRVEVLTGLKLFPTYSYFRMYSCGASLKRHRDRVACEISVTANVAQRAPEAWPIWIQNIQGPKSIPMKPGDATIYRGVDCPHWRETFEGELAVQIFLHYVDKNGPYAEWKFDKRKG